MIHDVHQRDKSAMAPADHADAAGIQEAIVLKHPQRGVVNVVHFQTAIVDLLIKFASIAGAATVVRSDDRVSLLDQFAYHMQIAGVEIRMNALMRENDQRLLLAVIE